MRNWQPITHSDTTDMAAKPAPVLFDDEHAPFEFVLDAQDLAFAAVARRQCRSYGEPIIWLDGEAPEP